jgi:hypothetical protein
VTKILAGSAHSTQAQRIGRRFNAQPR